MSISPALNVITVAALDAVNLEATSRVSGCKRRAQEELKDERENSTPIAVLRLNHTS